jgi:hypothetical protein
VFLVDRSSLSSIAVGGKMAYLRDINCFECFKACKYDWENFASCGKHGEFTPVPSKAVRISNFGIVSIGVD